MKIKEIQIENFKGIKSLTIPGLGDANFFIGKNNSGKSTVLESFFAFFSNNFFRNKLFIPPNSEHRSPDGRKYPPKISFIFEWDRIADKKKFLVQATKKNFEESNTNIEEIYDIKFDTTTRPANMAKTKSEFLIDLISRYSGKQKFISSSSLFRCNFDLKKYYDTVYGSLPNNKSTTSIVKEIINSLDNAEGSDQYRDGRDFWKEINSVAPKDFAEFTERFIKRDGTIEFEKDKDICSMSYLNQGRGELDTLQLFWALSPLRFKHQGQILIIDEPEQHKHYSLQRKILKKIIDLSQNNQIFVATQSPVFASQYWRPNCKTFLVSRNKDLDKNYIKLIETQTGGREINKMLGALNIYNFFQDTILFVEGETEEKIIPSIFMAYGKDQNSLGLKIQNAKGISNLNYSNLKMLLDILKDTNITPFILSDNENEAEKNREDIIKSYPDLFKKEEQYFLWPFMFVNALPTKIVFEAFNNLLRDNGVKPLPEIKTLEKWKKDKKSLENELQNIYHNTTQGGLSKSTIADYISQQILSIKDSHVVYKENLVFKKIKFIIDACESISNSIE